MGGDAFWFQHDSNAKDDPKCSLLIDQLGLEGYGIYWILVETLRDQPGYRYPLALLHVLARKYNTTAEKCRVVVGNYGLFVVDGGEFFLSPALCRRMEAWDVKREINRLAGLKSGVKRRLAAAERIGNERSFNDRSTTVEQEHNMTRQDNKYNKQQTTGPSPGQIAGVDNVTMDKIIGVEAAKYWRTERGHEYCQAQLDEMDRQGDKIRNPQQWLLSALQINWAKWQAAKPKAPKPDPHCPVCGGRGVIADFTSNQTQLCSCVSVQPVVQAVTTTGPPAGI